MAHLAATPAWRDARHIALYLASDGEIDCRAIAERAWSEERAVYLPRIVGRTLEFARWEAGAALRRNHFDIGEPAGPAVLAADLDLITLPLVAFDAAGNRLGMGGGYYDRTLAESPGPLRLGLAYQCQQVPAVPGDPWDMALDAIASEETLIPCSTRWPQDRHDD